MKINSLKNKLAVILSALMVLSVALGVIGFNTARANGTALNEIVTDFTMGGGQSVRLAKEDGDPKGMRFIAHLSADDFDAINNAGYDSVEYGYFIMPAYYETKIGAINEENTFGTNAKYTWTGKIGAGTYAVIHNVGAEPVLDEDAGNYLIKGSVVTMQPQNLATKYTGKMYIKATKGDVSEYVFADALVNKYSMIDVAIMAMDTGVEDDSLQDYIDDYNAWHKQEKGVDATYSYSVNYIENGEIVDTQVVNGIDINTDISITATAPNGYILDLANSEKNVLSGKVYADNSLTLTVYVKSAVYELNKNGKEDYFVFSKNVDGYGATYGSKYYSGGHKLYLPEIYGGIKKIEFISKDGNNTITEPAISTYNVEETTAYLGWGAINGTPVGAYDMKVYSIEGVVYTSNIFVADFVVYTKAEVEGILHAYDKQGAAASKYIALGQDVSFGGADFANVATVDGSEFTFLGTFDGKGYAISDINITGVGLFGYLGTTATVKNLAIINATTSNHAGGAILAGYSYGGTISNVYVQGSSAGHSGILGVDNGNSKVSSCIANVLGTHQDGWWYTQKGVVLGNKASNTTATNCYGISSNFKGVLGKDGAQLANTTALLNTINGTLPSGFNSYWSFNTNGDLCFGSNVIIAK